MYKPITLLEVAQKAQVSPATVSRVLNQPQLVKQATRVKVQTAVSRLGYVANTAARNLRQKRNNAVLIMVPTVGAPFFAQVLSGIEHQAAQYGYSILITHAVDYEGKSRRDFIHSNRTDGIVIFGGSDHYKQLQTCNDLDYSPIVAVNEKVDQHNLPSVCIDGYQAARQAVQYLIGLGHKRIGHIAGPLDSAISAIDRRQGFIDTLEENLLQPSWIFSAQYNMESGVRAANIWIALSNKPTALFCSCDEVAFGFMSEIHRQGFRVPQDVSVIGFDDIPLAEFCNPTITTVRQPYIKIGEHAIRTLVAKIRGQKIQTLYTTFTGELIIRESTARYRAS